MTRLEHRIPPPVVGLVTAAAMWGIDRASPSLRFPFAGHVAPAAAIGIAGLAVDVAGMLQFRKLRSTVNPLRTAYLANPLSLLGIPCFVAYLGRFQIRPEERALQARFGAEFLAYRERVRRSL